jgi:hypothetical protein
MRSNKMHRLDAQMPVAMLASSHLNSLTTGGEEVEHVARNLVQRPPQAAITEKKEATHLLLFLVLVSNRFLDLCVRHGATSE